MPEPMKGDLSKERERRLRIVTVVLALAFGFGVVEIALRIVGYVPTFISSEMFLSRAGLPDAELRPYSLRPGFTGSYAGARVTIDSEGNRLVVDPSHSLIPPQTSRSILLVGDSVVFGQGLSDEETITSRLQAELVRENQRLRIQNIGVPGYSTWNEYIAVREFLETHRPERVILVYVGNDATLDNDSIRLDTGFTLVKSSPVHRVLEALYRHVYASSIIADGIKHVKTAFVRQERRRVSFDLQGLAYSMEALGRLRDLCDRVGARFEVGIYRDVVAHADPVGTAHYEKALIEKLSALGVRWFLLKSHIENLDPPRAQVAWNDPHPSAAATRWLVQDILVELRTSEPRELAKDEP